jgi:hypothetical protein
MTLAMTEAGKSATVDNINFFKTSTDLKPKQDNNYDMPDFYYISPNVDWAKYKKIVVNDFSSLTTDINNISGFGIPEFRNMRKDMPDNIAQSLDGSVFLQCVRSTQRIDHTDSNSIKDVQADAILFGNISWLKTGLRYSSQGGQVGLTSTQVEIKLVDRKTSQEIMKIINRSSTDGDKVLYPILKRLTAVLNKAKSTNQEIKEMPVASVTNEQKESKSELPSSIQPTNINSNLPIKYLIVIKKVNVRANNNTKSEIIITLKPDEKVEKIDEDDKWFKIKTTKGESGWIIKSAAKKAE